MSSKTHYHRRAYQRASISSIDNANKFASNARRFGHSPSFYQDNPLAQDFLAFLERKQHTGKKIKVYRQWIFVFNSSNPKPTTVYEIPEEFRHLITSGYKTKVTFTFFHPISITLVQDIKYEDLDFNHIRSVFAHLLHNSKSLSDLGPFCLKQNGRIEKDFKVVGTWRSERRAI